MNTKDIIIVSSTSERIEELIPSLKHLGYQIDHCQNGEAVFQQIRKKLPGAILSDLVLPDINGPELCWLLREKENLPWLPFVIISDTDDLEVKLNCFRSGVDDVIIQPVSSRELIIRLEVLIRRFQKLSTINQRVYSAFSGDLQEFNPTDVIQWLFNQKKTGLLWLSHLYERGSLYFEDGTIKNALLKNSSGEIAVYEMLSWKEGNLEFIPGKSMFVKNVKMGTMEILLQFSKRYDEHLVQKRDRAGIKH